jgi:hypothetical protein
LSVLPSISDENGPRGGKLMAAKKKAKKTAAKKTVKKTAKKAKK